MALAKDLKAIARIAGSIGSEGFFDVGCCALYEVMPADDIMAFYYRPRSAPTLLATNNGTTGYEPGLQTFLSSTYILNPVYLAYRSGLTSGVFRVKDLLKTHQAHNLDEAQFQISVDQNEILGFRSYGWPQAQICMSLITSLPDGHMLEFALLRNKETGFTKAEQTHLQLYAPLIFALVEKQFHQTRTKLRKIPAPRQQPHAFESFCADILTKREREVVKLILTGHSGQAIALKLGTALATAKTHRYNIYSKLGISSQAELFSAFLRFLTEPSDDGFHEP